MTMWRRLLDNPEESTQEGLRDRAILAVGLQVGLRRAEIAALKVGDLHQNRGFDSLRIVRKGGRREALAIHPQTATRIRAYLAAAGHAEDLDGPLFRPLSHNCKMQEARRGMHPDAIDRVLRKHAKAIGIGGVFGALHAGNFHNDGARKRSSPGGRAAGGRAPRAWHNQALRPARIQSGKVGELLCHILANVCEIRDRAIWGSGLIRFPADSLTLVEIWVGSLVVRETCS
jgi:integrase